MKTYTAEQRELLAHILGSNEEFIREAKANGAVATIVPSDDIDMWIDMGVNNIEQYKRVQLEGEISDMFKEEYGVRPGPCNPDATIEQLEQELDSLYRSARQTRELEKQMREEQSRRIQERKARNKYQPNNVFAGLKDMIGATS